MRFLHSRERKKQSNQQQYYPDWPRFNSNHIPGLLINKEADFFVNLYLSLYWRDMKRSAILLSLLIVVLAAVIGAVSWRGVRSVMPSAQQSSSTMSVGTSSSPSSIGEDLPAGIDDTGMNFSVPAGMRAEIFASGLSGARDIVQDSFGNFWVSRPSEGIVTQLEMSGSTVRATYDIFRGLKGPHGLTIDPVSGIDLFIAEETSIKKARLYSDAPVETIAELPAGGRHTTRTLGIGPDDRLYVSIGSTCDVCVEANELHGTIITMTKDGEDQKIVARGLRNAVFFTWSLVDGRMWATDMGRDMLGNDLPLEEVNIIKEGSHYGWPFCYGDRVRDMSFQPSTNFDCATTEPPHLTLPAHIAPLGLSFIPEEGWPEEYWYDLLVAEHGSWNSTVPVGYDVVRIPLDAQGNREGDTVPFLSGFHTGRAANGRPVDLFTQPGGVLYVTDDKKGVVYRLTMQEPAR